MKNYLYVINKHEYKEKININNIIDSVKETEHTFLNMKDGNIECINYTNEDIDLKEMSLTDDYFIGMSGQLANTFTTIKDGIESSNVYNEFQFISNLAGANSISFYHKPTKRIDAYNSFSGVNPVYYCENENRIVIGIDPLIVNCVAYNRTRPLFDLENIAPFLMMGYFFSNDTLFKGVKSIPRNSFISVSKNYQIEIKEIDNSESEMFTIQPDQQYYDDLVHDYLKAFDVIPTNTNKRLSVGITGGKDSRLIALGLKEKNIDFDGITRGDEAHPDVIVGKMLASKLNLNHSVKETKQKKENILSINIVEKVLKTMLGTSGLLYGYENVNYSTTYKGNIGITGVGAEAIRGGFGVTRDKEVENISEFLIDSYFPYKDIILPKYRYNYEDKLLSIGSTSTSLRQTGNKLFLDYYNGKKTGAARLGLMYYNNSLSPFFDSNFLKKATKINMDEIASEKVQYNIMNTLNPEIAHLPFANSRWSFERRGPLDPNDFDGWLERDAVFPKSKRGGYNWRLIRNKDNKLISEFKSILLNEPDSEIYKVVDYNKISELFKNGISGNYNRVLWAMLSVKVYMDYYKNKDIIDNSKKITLSIPDSQEKVVNPPRIINLRDTLQSLNDKLIVTESKAPMISVNQESKNFGYLISGGNNLTTPVKIEYHDLFEIDHGRKSISIRFCFDVIDELEALSMYVMFFDQNGKRVESKEYKSNAQLGINYLSRTVKPNDKASTIKIAIKIKSKSRKPVLNYMYGYLIYN